MTMDPFSKIHSALVNFIGIECLAPYYDEMQESIDQLIDLHRERGSYSKLHLSLHTLGKNLRHSAAAKFPSYKIARMPCEKEYEKDFMRYFNMRQELSDAAGRINILLAGMCNNATEPGEIMSVLGKRIFASAGLSTQFNEVKPSPELLLYMENNPNMLPEINKIILKGRLAN